MELNFNKEKQSSLPIGVFDSGVGGLTVLKEIIAHLPNENFLYLGDTARVPYGTKSNAVIKKYALQMADFLLKKKIKLLVIACNTISSIARDDILKRVNIPVIDVVRPTAEYAYQKSKSKYIGLIGSPATIKNNFYQKYFDAQKKKARFKTQECPLFVSIVEEGLANHKIAKDAAEYYLKKFKNHTKTDTLILGCTHYPVLKNLISKNIDKNISIIESGYPTVLKLKQVLEEQNLLNQKNEKGAVEYFCTDSADSAEKFYF